MRLLLSTDMDRTLIPNGHHAESPLARERFGKLCQHQEIMLAYVTGRDQQLVRDAIDSYQLPTPDFAITDVGTKIYQIQKGVWQELSAWTEEISRAWQGKTHAQLSKILSPIMHLTLQEAQKQNTHKLSYYLPLDADHQKILQEVGDRLADAKVDASLIWSIDEPNHIGLLDILPKNATKLHAIEFLAHMLGYDRDEVLFAGDSGNDLPVLTSTLRSILVANASQEIKNEAHNTLQTVQQLDTLYIAQGNTLGMNGNYAAGILEGVWHFIPSLRESIDPNKVS